MQNVILVIHILACVALTAVVLLQRSEGGALGIGGGGSGGGLMSGRGAAGALVRTTMIFAGLFFVTSLVLTTLANQTRDDRSAAERQLEREDPAATEDLLDSDAPLLIDPLSEGDETQTVPDAGDPLAEGDESGEAPVTGDPLAAEPVDEPAETPSEETPN
jgi:preprotein translocase subunit SecG